MNEKKVDFLVIGTGVAGLVFALRTAEAGSVCMLCKKSPEDTNTRLAQGGISCVSAADDSMDLHIQDTIRSGAGLCREEAVRLLVGKAPEAIKTLESFGIQFHRTEEDEDLYSLHREGGHSRRRILHLGDSTGKGIHKTLLEAARKHPNIEILNDWIAIDLIPHSKLERRHPGSRNEQDVCWGAYVLDNATGDIVTFSAKATMLATGGAGKVYLYTTNSDTATGDGVAMAYRAGGIIANMEFFQFHPTCLYHPEAKSFLITEALRGEDGVLRLSTGEAFMEQYHELRDLAPRDVVARSIDHAMKETGEDCVFLDMTHRTKPFLKKNFPNIYSNCLKYGIDMAKDPIPVVPAAHYMCGGIVTDLEGQTNLRRLYACGETAQTGVHGANRLASNSLLEGVVFAELAARRAVEDVKSPVAPPPLPLWDSRGAIPSDETVFVSHSWDEIRRFMWNYVGIVRSDTRLERARRRLEVIRQEISDYYWKFYVTSDLVELRNIYTAADLIVRSAMKRKESRGLHHTVNYPDRDDFSWRRESTLCIGEEEK
ncbi:L-aspartate oxidase [Acidobacteriota bacterium]